MRSTIVRFDAPFWAALLVVVILTGSLECIGLAAAAQDASRSDIRALVTVDDS